MKDILKDIQRTKLIKKMHSFWGNIDLRKKFNNYHDINLYFVFTGIGRNIYFEMMKLENKK